MREHPQYGSRIPPEELEFLNQNRERNPVPGRGPQAPIHRGPRPPDRRPDDRRPERAGKPHRVGVQRAGEGPPRPVPLPEESPLTRFRRVLNAYQESAALLAGYSLGVFAEIHKRPQTSDDVARHCGADPRGTERLLNALVALGLLHKHGGTFVLPRDLAPFLVPGVDGDATGMVEFTADLYQAFGDLKRAARDGVPLHGLSSDALLSGDPEKVRRYIRAVHTSSRHAARRVVEMAPLLPGTTLLDVAGGSGIFSAEYARSIPELKATLFDLPPTVEVAREILAAEGVADRIEFREGDYRQDSFPGPVDAILLSNLLQTESEENCRLILRKAHEALRPGGTLLVHGTMTEADATKPLDAVLHSLLMLVVFDNGRGYSADEISGWLAQEGFGVRSTHPLGPPFTSKLIQASRLE